MASKPVAQLSAPEKEQLAVSYAALILSAQKAQVTADSINAVLTAAGLSASANLVKAFAKTLANKSASEFIGSVGSGSATSTATEAPTKAAGKDSKPADKGGKNVPPPPPPPAEEQEGVDMGGLFD